MSCTRREKKFKISNIPLFPPLKIFLASKRNLVLGNFSLKCFFSFSWTLVISKCKWRQNCPIKLIFSDWTYILKTKLFHFLMKKQISWRLVSIPCLQSLKRLIFDMYLCEMNETVLCPHKSKILLLLPTPGSGDMQASKYPAFPSCCSSLIAVSPLAS